MNDRQYYAGEGLPDTTPLSTWIPDAIIKPPKCGDVYINLLTGNGHGYSDDKKSAQTNEYQPAEFLATLVPGAEASWSLPTDPYGSNSSYASYKEIDGRFEFTVLFDKLSWTAQKYVILHEYTHWLIAIGRAFDDHSIEFSVILTALLSVHDIPSDILRDLSNG